MHDLLEKAMRSTRRAFGIEEDTLGVSARAWKDMYGAHNQKSLGGPCVGERELLYSVDIAFKI